MTTLGALLLWQSIMQWQSMLMHVMAAGKLEYPALHYTLYSRLLTFLNWAAISAKMYVDT